jgi:hypothetical protein
MVFNISEKSYDFMVTEITKLISLIFFSYCRKPSMTGNWKMYQNQTSSFCILGFSSSSPVVTNNLNPSLYPQVDLLALENTEIPP